MTFLDLIPIALLSGFLLVAVCIDHRSHRIPNWLTGTMLLVGISTQTLTAGFQGLGSALAGLLVGLAVFLLPYIQRSMAAGDVKLMAAVGAFIGAKLVLLAAVVSLVAGASIGLTLLAYRQIHKTNTSVDGILSMKFPYASAIAIGTAVALVTKEFQWTL